MTDAPKDGGAAFPRASNHVPQSDFPMGLYDNGDTGMSLRAYAAIKLRVPDSGCDWLDDMILEAKRDEFAGQVIAGFAATDAEDLPNSKKAIAECAYKWADAMLEARKR